MRSRQKSTGDSTKNSACNGSNGISNRQVNQKATHCEVAFCICVSYARLSLLLEMNQIKRVSMAKNASSAAMVISRA